MSLDYGLLSYKAIIDLTYSLCEYYKKFLFHSITFHSLLIMQKLIRVKYGRTRLINRTFTDSKHSIERELVSCEREMMSSGENW